MAARKITNKIFRIGYMMAMSNKVTEIRVKGITTHHVESGLEMGIFEILDNQSCTVFAIPSHSLVYCIVDTAVPKEVAPLLQMPLKA